MMGLYDTLKINYPLPDIPKSEIQMLEFQTKSLSSTMDNYTINEKGELILHEVEWEEVPEEERPFYGKPEWEHLLSKFVGSMKSIPIGDKLINYTGIINFYTNMSDGGLLVINFNENTINDKPAVDYGWIEFEAEFKNGILQNIELVEYREGKVE
jgi:hypothetical protein